MFFWQTIFPLNVVERIKQTKSDEGNLDHSSASRLTLWQDALNLFMESPVMGVGYAVVPFYGLSEGQNDTHNVYMKIFAEEGIIGIVIFLVLLMLCFRSGWKLYCLATNGFRKGLGMGLS